MAYYSEFQNLKIFRGFFENQLKKTAGCSRWYKSPKTMLTFEINNNRSQELLPQ